MGMDEEEEAAHISIDSGAVDTVGPKSAGRGFPIEQTEDSKAGRFYRAANGNPSRTIVRGRSQANQMRENT